MNRGKSIEPGLRIGFPEYSDYPAQRRHENARSRGRFHQARTRLLASGSLAILGMTGAAFNGRSPALAQCSALDVAGNATCLSGTYTNTTPQPPGTFPAPINYDTNDGLGGSRINLTLLPGVNVVLPAGPG